MPYERSSLLCETDSVLTGTHENFGGEDDSPSDTYSIGRSIYRRYDIHDDRAVETCAYVTARRKSMRSVFKRSQMITTSGIKHISASAEPLESLTYTHHNAPSFR